MNNSQPDLTLSPLSQTLDQAREALLNEIWNLGRSGDIKAKVDALIAVCRAEATAPLQATIDRLVSINQRLEQQLAEAHAEIARLKKLQAQTVSGRQTPD